MKPLFIIAIAITAGIVFVVFIWRGEDSPVSRDSKEPERPAAREQRLKTLETCGLKLSSDFTVSDLLESWPREDYEKPGYDLVLVGLGMTEERPPWRSHCKNLWHFDTECVEDDGSYTAIANRMSELANGSLPISVVKDHVDIEGGHAWLEFTCQSKKIRIDCKVEDDWVDPGVFGHFVRLLEKADPNKIYIYFDLGGQDCIIGCVTKEQFAKLKKIIPKVVPLS